MDKRATPIWGIREIVYEVWYQEGKDELKLCSFHTKKEAEACVEKEAECLEAERLHGVLSIKEVIK